VTQRPDEGQTIVLDQPQRSILKLILCNFFINDNGAEHSLYNFANNADLTRVVDNAQWVC